MSTVKDIAAAIDQLSPADFVELAAWFDRRRETDWDRQIRADATEGRLDRIWEQELKDIERGGARTLDEIIDHK